MVFCVIITLVRDGIYNPVTDLTQTVKIALMVTQMIRSDYWVYFIESVAIDSIGDVNQAVKIGYVSHKMLYRNLNVMRRGNPNAMSYIGILPCESKPDAQEKERELHIRFHEYKFHREWFTLEQEIQLYIRDNALCPDIHIENSYELSLADIQNRRSKRNANENKSMKSHRIESHRLASQRHRVLEKLSDPEGHAAKLRERNEKYRQRQIAEGKTVHSETREERAVMQEEAKALRTEGLSYSKIAAHFGKNIAWARRATEGVEKPVDTEELVARKKACKMRAEGMKLSDIESTLGKYAGWAMYVTQGIECPIDHRREATIKRNRETRKTD